MTNKTEFSIIYGGESYSNNQIDAKVLGSALSSLALLIEHSDKLLNGEDAFPKLTVKAHKEGSFEVICEAYGMSLNTLQALGLAVGLATPIATVWTVIDMLKGKEIGEVIEDKQNKSSKLIIDEKEIECSEDVRKLITSSTIRQEIDSLVYQPLKIHDSSLFEIKTSNNDVVARINKDNVTNFKKKSCLIKRVTENKEQELNINFAKVNFSSAKGWSIILPDKTQITIVMDDEDFLKRVNKNQTRFSKDDLFVVLLYTEVVKEYDNIIKTSHSIKKVIRHRVADEDKII